MENSIILDNSGDDSYKFLSRDWASNPIKCKWLKLILADDSQLSQLLTITSLTSTGAKDIREIAFAKYVSAENKNNLILTFPLEPELLLDGNTSFKLTIPAFGQVVMMFYYDQQIIGLELSK